MSMFSDATDKLIAENEELKDLFRKFVSGEDRPCWLDHHGNCQEHGWFINEDNEVCGIRRARKLLGLDT